MICGKYIVFSHLRLFSCPSYMSYWSQMSNVSNGMFASESTPKMPLDLNNKETITIVALEKMHIIGRKS